MQTIRNERGSVLVFMTLMIVLLLVMVGLGLDTGQLTYVRNQGQAAVDAAALAAVSALPSRNPTEVANRAAAYNSENDYVESPTNAIGSTNVSYVKYDFTTNSITNYNEPIGTANGVRVALEGAKSITTPMFLTPLMNLLGIATAGTQNLNVSAVSTITSKPAIPIALWSNVCPQYPGPYKDSTLINPNVNIQMQHPDQKTGNENSCWTTFLDCSSGAPDIKAGFQVAQTCSGGRIDGQIDIGTPICQNKGQVDTVLGNAKTFFSANDMPNAWWIIPVIQGGINCDPTNPTTVVTWAKIRPTAVVKTGNPKYITADVACGDDIVQELDVSLCFSHRLVREKVKGM
jgi:Flp pilus assembly protein TadG